MWLINKVSNVRRVKEIITAIPVRPWRRWTHQLFKRLLWQGHCNLPQWISLRGILRQWSTTGPGKVHLLQWWCLHWWVQGQPQGRYWTIGVFWQEWVLRPVGGGQEARRGNVHLPQQGRVFGQLAKRKEARQWYLRVQRHRNEVHWGMVRKQIP